MPGGASCIADVALEIGAGIRSFQLKVLLLLFGRARFEMRRPRLRRIGRVPVKQPQAWRQVAEILDDTPAIDPRTGLEHQHGQTGVKGVLRDQATDHSGSDNDDVCIVIARHPDNSSLKHRVQNSGMLPSGGASAVHPFGPEIAKVSLRKSMSSFRMPRTSSMCAVSSLITSDPRQQVS